MNAGIHQLWGTGDGGQCMGLGPVALAVDCVQDSESD